MSTPQAQPDRPSHCPAWMTFTLRAAAVYNILWGTFVIMLPNVFLNLLGVDDLSAQGTAIWQCVGMIVGVYGIGYWAAAENPFRHWPIVLVGFLGKVFGPIGFVKAVFIDDIFPPTFGLTILTNDIIWWIRFALILRATLKHHLAGNTAEHQ